jgi:hypothetical protein
MIITSHMQKSIQIYPCLLKLSRKQESVTDRQTDGRYYYIPSPLSQGDNTTGVLTPWLELFVTALADFL